MVASPLPANDRQSPGRRLVISLAVVVSLVLGPLAFAPAVAAGVGSISGTVVDSTSGEPVLAASVQVRPAGDDDAEPITRDAPGGAFTITDVPAGEYTVEISDVSGEHLPTFYNETQGATEAGAVVVVAGADKPLGEIRMDRGAILRGVVETTRVPLPGQSPRVAVPDATVVALRTVDGQVVQQYTVPATTDAAGRYSITHLRAGTYKLKVSAAGYFDVYSGGQPTQQLAEEEAVAVGADVTVDTIVIEQTAGIIGTVENASGASLEGITVDAYLATDGVQAAQSAFSAVTGENGSYVLHPLHAGEYRMRFRDASGVYRERFDTTMTIEGGENAANAETAVLARVTPVVPPAPYAPPAVAKKSASVKVSAKGGKKRATLTITVKASGVTPTGRVTIKLGSRTLKTVTLKRGKAKVTLKKQKKGKRTYKVVYAGDSKVRGKTVSSKKVKIR